MFVAQLYILLKMLVFLIKETLLYCLWVGMARVYQGMCMDTCVSGHVHGGSEDSMQDLAFLFHHGSKTRVVRVGCKRVYLLSGLVSLICVLSLEK